MRLIDADAADTVDICCFYGTECRLEDVEEWLNEQPTIDAEPVRHGQWYDKKSDKYPHMHSWRCSACEYIGSVNPIGPNDYKYCPNCGAKMDGVNQ